MGLLRQMFGPSRDEVWGALARELDADFSEGGFMRSSAVRVHVGEWTVTLDTLSANKTVYTRLRAPFVNADGFRFQVYRDGLAWQIGKFLGMQDVEVGQPEFDRDFVIRGNDESRLRQLFADEDVRCQLHAQREVHFEVRDDDGWFGARFPDGVDELYFVAHGVMKDTDRLRSLFALFAATLDRLTKMGSAYESDPGVRL